jgi:t-SNARE complex subunit (syntaxin)
MSENLDKKASPSKKMRSSNRHIYSRVGYDSDSDPEGDDFISQQIKQQQLELKRQDEGLDMLTESANRLGALSLGIHEELNQQNKMLDEMENDLDNATNNLEIITRKTKDLIEKSGGKKNFLIILVMSIIVVVLLFLIIYT